MPLSRRLATLAGAFAALSLAAPAAQAGSFEQVSRATGGAGWSTFTRLATPIFVSDSGRFAIFEYRTRLAPGGIRLYVRDIVTNTTTALDPNIVSVYGVDRAEQHLLVQRRDGFDIDVVLVPLTGGAPKVLVSTQTTVPSAAISGDGKTVVYSLDDGSADAGSFRTSLATGQTTKFDDTPYEFGPRSLSDDGSVVAGTNAFSFPEEAFVWRGGVKSAMPGRAVVSPDGSTAATSIFRDGEDYLVTRRLADGTTKEFPIPGDLDNLSWIAPDGQKFIVANYSGSETPAQVLDVPSGKWRPVASRYIESVENAALAGRDFRGSGDTTVLSRSGRYILSSARGGYGNTVNLIDLWNRDLPGAQEAPSPSAYFSIDLPLYGCETERTFRIGYFARPSWFPKAKSASVTVTIDGKVTFRQTFTTPDPFAETSFPTNAKSIVLRVAVTDLAGKTQTTTETVEPTSDGTPCEL